MPMKMTLTGEGYLQLDPELMELFAKLERALRRRRRRAADRA
jgi:hypothetical protein